MENLTFYLLDKKIAKELEADLIRFRESEKERFTIKVKPIYLDSEAQCVELELVPEIHVNEIVQVYGSVKYKLGLQAGMEIQKKAMS